MSHSGGPLSPEWFVWYGMQAGLTYDQALDIPEGELLDYMAIQQIKKEGFQRRKVLTRDEEIIPDVR